MVVRENVLPLKLVHTAMYLLFCFDLDTFSTYIPRVRTQNLLTPIDKSGAFQQESELQSGRHSLCNFKVRARKYI